MIAHWRSVSVIVGSDQTLRFVSVVRVFTSQSRYLEHHYEVARADDLNSRVPSYLHH